MILRIFRFAVGLMILPFCFVITQTLIDILDSLNPGASEILNPPLVVMTGGFIIWQIVYFLMPRPVRTYVLAHELTHALWGTLMGATVSKISVKKDHGYVSLSKTNFLITLAPYFFPLYTFLVIIAFYISSIFIDMRPYYLVWLCLVGFTWGFHLNFTLSTLLQHQPDIKQCGHLFSYVVIYLLNVAGICIWAVMVSNATLQGMIELFYRHTVADAVLIWHKGCQLFQLLYNNG